MYVADTSLRRGAVSCSSSLCASGREAYPVSTSLGEVHHRCMGFVGNSRGIGSCVSGTPSFVGQSDSYVSDLRHDSTILSTTGLSEFSSQCGSSRSPSHSTSPVLSSGTLGLRFSSLRGSSTYSPCLTASPRLVDSQGKCFDRCSFASPSSFSNSIQIPVFKDGELF